MSVCKIDQELRPRTRPEKQTTLSSSSKMNTEITFNSQKQSQNKVNIRIRELTLKGLTNSTVSVEHFRELLMSYSQKLFPLRTLNSGGTALGFLHLFLLQLRTSNSETMSSDIIFILYRQLQLFFSPRD